MCCSVKLRLEKMRLNVAGIACDFFVMAFVAAKMPFVCISRKLKDILIFMKKNKKESVEFIEEELLSASPAECGKLLKKLVKQKFKNK